MKLPSISAIGNFFPKPRPQTPKPSNESRPYTVAQIEVTSRCSTGCVFCPHDSLSERWINGDLSLHLYRERITPFLDLFDLVYLQGWGEPMLHPDLWEMLSLAQQKGCRTGFTTNGAWLHDEENRRLVDQNISMISVSFAGQAPSIHQSLRTNSDFSELCRNFNRLANLKKQRGIANPWLELHFLMTRANLGELPSVVELAASLGADEVVATNLTYSPSITLDRMHVFSESPLQSDVEIIAHAKKNAEKLNIPLRVYPVQAEMHTLVCDADPVNTVYINHRGEVTPCVYLGLTIQDQIPRYYLGEAHPFETVSFGDLDSETGLDQVLQSVARRKFVSIFERRKASNNPFSLLTYMSSQTDEAELPSAPLPCQHCYKLLGV